jgi:putative membrane protein
MGPVGRARYYYRAIGMDSAFQGRPRNMTMLGWFAAGAVAVATMWSGVAPADRLTWWLEIAWVIVGLPVVVVVARTRGITPMLVFLLTLHAIVLCVGAHYTYEHVPLGEWVRNWTGGNRNNFDRLGHLMQGIVPAIIARELLRRTSPVPPGAWLRVLMVALAVAFSSCFEMIEWCAAVLLGSSADAYLGSQGDPWDAQWDMFCALIGATAATLALSAWHERQLICLQRDAAGSHAQAPRSR